jgi:hypothetical protein
VEEIRDSNLIEGHSVFLRHANSCFYMRMPKSVPRGRLLCNVEIAKTHTKVEPITCTITWPWRPPTRKGHPVPASTPALADPSIHETFTTLSYRTGILKFHVMPPRPWSAIKKGQGAGATIRNPSRGNAVVNHVLGMARKGIPCQLKLSRYEHLP